MLNLLHAEWLKIRTNRTPSVFTIGMLPILAFVLLNILTILAIFNLWQPNMPAINWQEQIILALLFANQLVSQLLFIILGAISFGGEYRWQTWKNIIPRAKRIQLVLAKCLMLMLAIIFAIHSLALATFIGSWEISLALAVPFASGAWNETAPPFAMQYLWLTGALFFNYFMGMMYAIISTLITRSTIAGIVLGGLIAFGDLLLQQALSMVGDVIGADILMLIPRVLPNYNVQNMMQWVIDGTNIDGWSLRLSSAILCLWVMASISLSVILFKRQDID